MKILALIPARGGSKGVAGKNIRLLGGIPLISHSVRTALQSKHVTDLALTSDSEEILRLASVAGASLLIQRPAELALDHTPTLPVVLHALEVLLRQGRQYDAVCLLQPTTPFRPEGFVDRAIDCFRRSGADSLVSVLPVPHEFNPHWTFEPAANGFLKIATGDETIIPRRQELPPAYFRDGSVYITRVDILKIHGSLYGKSIAYIVSDTSLYVNIDTPEDWEKAEKLIFQNKVVLPSK